MIARFKTESAQAERSCSPNPLRDLLNDELPTDQVAEIQKHLDQCIDCRETLRMLAGSDRWWTETHDMLGHWVVERSTRQIDSQTDWTATREFDQSQWIQPLLRPSDSPDHLGRLGVYPVVDFVGQGGMGVVLRGIDPELNRPVAIKVLSPHLAGVGAARQRFMREAQAAAAIVHPNVIPIYGIETGEPLPMLVMPFLSGGNLQQRIDRDGALPLEEVLHIGCQVADGLAAAHAKGVIHRDVKPANILVEASNGRILISDFGLARALDDATLTASGMITGTPQYMSPEQARGDSIDARSDLFSLGSLLYALSTGRPPYRADGPLAVLRKITEQPPRPVHEINERMPTWLSCLIEQLMTIEVESRIGSAEQASKLLRDAWLHVRQPSQSALPESLKVNDVLLNKWQGVSIVAASLIGALGVLLWFDMVLWSGRANDHPPHNRVLPSVPPVVSEPVIAERAKTTQPVPVRYDLTWEALQWQNDLRQLQLDMDVLRRSVGEAR